jgi:hypothetical protein
VLSGRGGGGGGVSEQDQCPYFGIGCAETSGKCEYNYTDKDGM